LLDKSGPEVTAMHSIAAIHKIVRAWRQMLRKTGREPAPAELVEKLDMPLETVRYALKNAEEPILLESPYA
jgi:RNA polymerase primary sigma factor